MLTAAFMEGGWCCYKWDYEKRSNQCCSFYIRASEVKWIIAFHQFQVHSVDIGGYQFSELIIKTVFTGKN